MHRRLLAIDSLWKAKEEHDARATIAPTWLAGRGG